MAFVIADRVKEQTSTTGTGALTLAGAATGYRAMSAVLAVNDTVYYAIEAVDASGGPSGDWEVGLGTYSGANTLTRTTVLASSNAGAAVNLAAGTKNVFLTVPATQAAWIRERLTAARTYYVRTDGSDSNNGMANTAGGAFLTIQKAVDVIGATLDLGIYAVTIQVADGTYSGTISVPGPFTGTGLVTLKGNTATPANVILTSGGNTVQVADGGKFQVLDCKISSTVSNGLRALRNGVLFFGNVELGSCTNSHIITSSGGIAQAVSSYTISGGAANHINAITTSIVQVVSVTVTLTGTPAFSSAFALGGTGGQILVTGLTFSGSATGARYTITGNSVCDTGGGGATYLPGNAAHGTPTATGGQYI